jgi:hypothetical protein
MNRFINGLGQGSLIMALTSTAGGVDVGPLSVSALLKSQTSYSTVDNNIQQQEWLFDTEMNQDFFDGELTTIARVRWDTDNTLNASHNAPEDSFSAEAKPLFNGDDGLVELREVYWQVASESVYWKIGKQQVVWGESDGLKLLDAINPQRFREFTLDGFDDSRIPLWMLNAEISVGADSLLQILLITDTSTHELAPLNSPFYFTSALLVPVPPDNIDVQINPAKSPSGGLDEGDFGMRWVSFVSGWDVSANYLYHYVDTPVVRASLQDSKVVVTQEYERSHLVGGSANTSLGQWIVRGELAYETDRYMRSESVFPGVIKSDVLSWVMGWDWQGWSDQFVSLQYFQANVLESASDLVMNKSDEKLSLLWESKFFNETLTLKYLGLYSLNDQDGINQIRVTYNYQSNMDLYVGGDQFYGDRQGLFGQFDQADRIMLGVNWGVE